MNNNISSTKKLVIDESEPTQVDIVVHLGAGSGADVDYYQSLSPSHIYLFEGVISQCELLSQRFNVTKNVSVHHKMINPFDSAVTFQQIQPTQFSGVACVDKFSKKFKNLKVIDELNIQPFSLQDVINQIPELSNNNLSEDNTSMLVIQLNGLEFDLINYSQYQALALFDNIVIQSIKDNASSAYETARSKALNSLFCVGYELVSIKSDSVFMTYELLLKENQSALTANNNILSNSIFRVNELNQQLTENVESLKSELQCNKQILSDSDKKAKLQLEQYQLSASEELLALTNDLSQLEVAKDKAMAGKMQAIAECSKVKAASDKALTEKMQAVDQCNQYKAAKEKAEVEKAQAVEQSNQFKTERDKAEAEKAHAVELSNQYKAAKEKAEAEKAQAIEESNKLQVARDKVETERAQAVEQRNQLQAQRDKAEVEKDLVQSQLEQLQKDSQAKSEDLTSHISQLQSKVSELEADVTEITLQRDNEHKWHLDHKSWAESLTKQLETQKQELFEVSRSSNLGQKILAKSQLDIEHLRNSYAEKVQSEQELIELVKELKQKLTLASKYYFQLQQEHPELLNSIEHIERDL
jgi:hypothetical protein